MPTPHHFKPTHQPIKEYYRGHEVCHELAVKTAFQRLLEVTARKHDWHLVPEQPTTVRGKSIRPDGTLRDSFNLHRGYARFRFERMRPVCRLVRTSTSR